jgi:hypothetical protein
MKQLNKPTTYPKKGFLPFALRLLPFALLLQASLAMPVSAARQRSGRLERKHSERISTWDADPLRKSADWKNEGDGGSLRDGPPDGPALGDVPLQDSLGWLLLLGAGYAVVQGARRRKGTQGI